ncbi:MAG: glycerol-3-phosphate 1-O-acyltransferase PlsY [Bacteroidales bacterium]
MTDYRFYIAFVLAYLIGSIPTSVWIGRLFYGVDVRTKGSGNAGATNTIRVLGWQAGVPVLLLDVAKGWFAVYLGDFFYQPGWVMPGYESYEILLAGAAVLGHVFPIYVGFKGGKGIATLLGIGLALFPVASLIAVAVFTVVLLSTGYVSLGSIIASVTFPLTEMVILHHTGHLPMTILAISVAVFVPITHHKNIRRLLRGEESRFTLKKKS